MSASPQMRANAPTARGMNTRTEGTESNPTGEGLLKNPVWGASGIGGCAAILLPYQRRRPQNLILSRRASAVSKDGRRLPSCESASFDTPPSAATQDEEDGSGACPERSRGAATQDEGDVRTFSTTPAKGRSRSRADSRVRSRAIDAPPARFFVVHSIDEPHVGDCVGRMTEAAQPAPSLPGVRDAGYFKSNFLDKLRCHSQHIHCDTIYGLTR